MNEQNELYVDPEAGLSSAQVRVRIQKGLRNRISESNELTDGQIIRNHLLTFFNLVFAALALVLLICGSSVKNLSFLLIVAVNAAIGCIQQIRAKRAVSKLTLMSARTVRAVREGTLMKLHPDMLVRDDIVEFSAGDQICADACLCCGQVQVNESLITGEADAISKEPGDALLSGSFVIAGKCRARLTQVGDASFAARLAQEAKKDPKVTKSEMMRSLDMLIRVVGFALIPIGIVLFYQEYQVLRLSLRESAEATVAALIGMIPEGLYLLTSIAMAASAIKLTRKRVLVQDNNCIETLARVDVLCVDKTGTITEPVMEVEDILPLGEEAPEYLESVMTALYGAREPENDTGRALAEMFSGSSDWECTRYVPFESRRKWSGGEFENHGAFVTGAPEFIMGARYEELREDVENWQSGGCRVLLAARYAEQLNENGLEPEKITPLALIVLSNRIRPEAPKTFAYFAAHDVAIKVISGDNAATVSAVACRAGIRDAEQYIDARELKTPADIFRAAQEYTVFGRVTPDQKKLLVQALKRQGHTVAMTGDGVNDVLALKEADCGIAMASGAQAASQVAQLVLLDSDFAAMPSIVGEGCRVINNIQRAASLFLVKNIFSFALSIISILTSWPYPLAPLHLSIISMLTIGVPSFFLAMEPNYERVQGRFLAGVLHRAFPGGLTNIFAVVMAQAFMSVFSLPLAQIQTVCTAILAVVGMLVLFQICKPFNRFRKLIWAAMGIGLVICFTFLGELFEIKAAGQPTALVMVTLLIMTPTVFFAFDRLFALGNRLIAGFRQKVQTHRMQKKR